MKTNPLLIFFFCFVLGLPALADERVDSLRNVINTTDNEISRMHAQTLLAVEYMPADMNTARELLEAASALATAVDHPAEMAAWLNISGNYNWFSGNRDSAMVNYRITYSLEALSALNRKAAAAVNMGILFNSAGKIDSARFYKTKAREMFIELDDSAGIAHTNRSLGVFYFFQNNYELSLRHHLEALKYHESVQDTFALIYGYDSMGNVLSNLSQFEEAENYLQKAIHLSEHYPVTPNMGSIYNNLSTLHEKWGVNHPEKSIEYAQKGLEALKKHPNASTELSLYANLGVYYLSKQDYKQSSEWFAKAFDADAFGRDTHLHAGLLMNYGRLLAATGDYAGARRYLEQTIDLSNEISFFLVQKLPTWSFSDSIA